MEPGDVLVHDVMLIHGSPPVEGKDLRRTLYYEFRAAEQILTEGPWDGDWVQRRLRLIPPALAGHARAFPDAPQYVWQAAPELRPEALGDEPEELRIAHELHTPGTLCSAGSV